jgi:POT family proton-dependent oligopeptide transporter
MPVTGAAFAAAGERIELVWFVLTFMLMVCGELCIAPVAMNLVSRLCPARVVGMMMGAYFLSMSIGSFAAGRLASLTRVGAGEAGASIVATLPAYVSTYGMFAAAAAAAALVLYLLTPLLHRRMHN